MSKDLVMQIQKVGADSNLLRPAFEAACEELTKVLQRKAPMTDMARVATVTVGSFAKLKQSEIHEKANQLALAKYLSTNK